MPHIFSRSKITDLGGRKGYITQIPSYQNASEAKNKHVRDSHKYKKTQKEAASKA